MTGFEKFMFAVCEFGPEEACLVFGMKKGDPKIKEWEKFCVEFLDEQTKKALALDGN